MDRSYIIVMVTTLSRQEAEKIANQLLEEKLIACANIVGPVSSIFRWKDKIENAEEHVVLMKSRRDLFEKLSETVEAVHSYEVPEIIAWPLVEGSRPYTHWLESNLTRVAGGRQ